MENANENEIQNIVNDISSNVVSFDDVNATKTETYGSTSLKRGMVEIIKNVSIMWAMLTVLISPIFYYAGWTTESLVVLVLGILGAATAIWLQRHS